MRTSSNKTDITILKALTDIGEPAGAARVSDRLQAWGIRLQPRTVRLHLLQLDQAGLTRFISKRRGREITDLGREELAHANVVGKIGFVAARLDTLSYRMTFDCGTGEGSIVANTAVVSRRDISRALTEVMSIYEKGLSMGALLSLAQGGESLGGEPVPPAHISLATICSVTINGILLRAGIPVAARFGGLLEMQERQPIRFVELMDYTGTTVDPLGVFVGAGMTGVRECARTGSGIIGASFREIPSAAISTLRDIQKKMQDRGLAGILAIGNPNQPLLDIPVAEGRTGVIVMAGLNPLAAIHEAGIPSTLRSLTALEDFGRFKTPEHVYREYMDSLR